MKPVIIFALTFIVAASAATGAKIAIGKPGPAVSDSTHADSTKADSAKSDSTHADSSKPVTDTAAVASGQPVNLPIDTARRVASADSAKPIAKPIVTPTIAAAPATKPLAEPTPSKAPTKTPVKAPTNAPTTATTATAAPATDPAGSASEKRIAQVFTSMDAKQAAKVLEHMSDNDVHVILGYVGVKQAAQIMAALPPERVATLSKLSLGKNK